MRLRPEVFLWDTFRDPDDLGRRRLDAMHRFLDDFERGVREGRYVVASLPNLPFADGEFRLALVSHLLFLYSEQLDEAAHVASVVELLRVAEEVRLFPLVTLGHRRSPHVEPVRSGLVEAGYSVDVVTVGYEFQRVEGHGGSRMMRISRRQSARSDSPDDRDRPRPPARHEEVS